MTDASVDADFDGKAVLVIGSVDPRRMKAWPKPQLPGWLVVFELEIGGNLDVRYRRRTGRIAISNDAELKAALARAYAGNAAPYHEPHAQRLSSALSVGVSGQLIYAVLLDPHRAGKSQLRFSSTHPPFMAGTEEAERHQFSACNVSFNTGAALIGEPNASTPTASDGRMALFMIDLESAGQERKALPFNVNLEVRGRISPGQGGASYITPIIIDPDLRHPPEEGGIPTHP